MTSVAFQETTVISIFLYRTNNVKICPLLARPWKRRFEDLEKTLKRFALTWLERAQKWSNDHHTSDLELENIP